MNDDEIVIREATLHDCETLGILLDKYRIFYNQKSDLESSARFIKERISNNESLVFIACDAHAVPVGFVQLYPVFSTVSLKRQWLLNDLFIEEPYRKKGIAKKLLLHTQSFLEKSAKGIILVTSKDNSPAKHLYETVGWKTGAYDFYYHMF